MTPYYDAGGVTIYCGDCREILPTVSADVLVTDPPYGIGYDGGATQRRSQGLGGVHGDDGPFNPDHLLGFKDAILWGANNYARDLPASGQWYAWDKVLKNGLGVRIAECEYAWHQLGTKPRIFRHLWSGAYRASESGELSMHPTQKPILLMQWCIGMIANGVIADPYAGSGTTLVAAKNLGRRAIGIEIEERYCEISARRLSQEVLNFEEKNEKQRAGVQGSLLEKLGCEE